MRLRGDLIRTKIKEIKESIRSVEENLPDTLEEFEGLGLIKDGNLQEGRVRYRKCIWIFIHLPIV